SSAIFPPPPTPRPFPYTTLFRSRQLPQPPVCGPPFGSSAMFQYVEARAQFRSGPIRLLRNSQRRFEAAFVDHAPPVHSDRAASRSEEHTSELQSRRDLVCRLLLE